MAERGGERTGLTYLCDKGKAEDRRTLNARKDRLKPSPRLAEQASRGKCRSLHYAAEAAAPVGMTK